jgi:hypothetical protein
VHVIVHDECNVAVTELRSVCEARMGSMRAACRRGPEMTTPIRSVLTYRLSDGRTASRRVRATLVLDVVRRLV